MGSVCVVDGRVELELRLAEGIKFYLNRMRAIISLWLKIYNFGQFLRQLVTIVVRLHSRLSPYPHLNWTFYLPAHTNHHQTLKVVHEWIVMW